MKKFFMLIAVVALLIVGQSAHATPVQIYDSDFDKMLTHFKLTCQLMNVDIWGTEYYTYQGAQRCEVHFGNSKSNTIRFRLNNDNSISRVLITTPSKYLVDNDVEVLFVFAGILHEIGLSQSELETLGNKLGDKIDRMSSYSTHIHERSSVWCSKTRRYVTLDLEMDYSKVDFYLYASI